MLKFYNLPMFNAPIHGRIVAESKNVAAERWWMDFHDMHGGCEL